VLATNSAKHVLQNKKRIFKAPCLQRLEILLRFKQQRYAPYSQKHSEAIGIASSLASSNKGIVTSSSKYLPPHSTNAANNECVGYINKKGWYQWQNDKRQGRRPVRFRHGGQF